MTEPNMMNRRTFLTTTISSTIVGGLAGCIQSTEQPRDESDGSETTSHKTHENTSDHDHNQASTGPVEHAEVAMMTNDAGYHFDPHIVWVSKGGAVTWTLKSGSHTTTAYHSKFNKPRRIPQAADAWDSGMLMNIGATVDRTFEIEGVYDYFCIPHEYRGMVGSIIVGHPTPEKQPGLAPPQVSLPNEAQTMLKTLNKRVTHTLKNTH
jgi:plastocyanin